MTPALNAARAWWRSPYVIVPAGLVLGVGSVLGAIRLRRRERGPKIHDGVIGVGEPKPPRMPVPPDYWGIAHEASLSIVAPSYASGPEASNTWGVTGCEKDHPCQRGEPPQPTYFAVPLGPAPQQSSDYRAQVQLSDPNGTQANTVVEGQRWWIAGDPGPDLWGHTHNTQPAASSTCYGEDIEQRIDIVNGELVPGRESWIDFDCGPTTPMQTYSLERRRRKFRGRWVWQYEDYNKIVTGAPYSGGRLYDLRIEPRDGTVMLVGAIAPTLPELHLDLDVKWWRRAAVDA